MVKTLNPHTMVTLSEANPHTSDFNPVNELTRVKLRKAHSCACAHTHTLTQGQTRTKSVHTHTQTQSCTYTILGACFG